MSLHGTLLFLGTGGSMGVPIIGCDCDVCRSSSPFNKRLRPSALLTVNGKTILIDCGPDLRYQALRAHIKALDGLIVTHAHHDHTAGVDDLRVLYIRTRTAMPCLLSKETAESLKIRFAYIFEGPGPYEKLLAKLDFQILPTERGEVSFLGLPIRYFTYEQGGMVVNGFRFDDLAFVSDICHYSPTIFEDLKGVKTLVVSALRFEPSPLHFNIDQAVEFSKKVGAEQTWLTHIGHELDHEKGNRYLPPNVRLAYDGLSIQF